MGRLRSFCALGVFENCKSLWPMQSFCDCWDCLTIVEVALVVCSHPISNLISSEELRVT